MFQDPAVWGFVALGVLFLAMGQQSLRRRVDVLSRQVESMRQELNLGESSMPHMPEVERLVREGRKIEAIKVYREMTGLGLKEAKDAVDTLQAGLR